MKHVHPSASLSIFAVLVITFLMLFPASMTQAGSPHAAHAQDQIEGGGAILYVKSGSTGGCSSWDDACGLQTALTIAAPGDQIWVQAGIYKPDEVDFASCQEIRAASNSADDGTYLIQSDGKPFYVYCADMAGTPKEYLELKYPESNFSQYTAGVFTNGTSVVTQYKRIRILPETLQVDIGDQTFANSSGGLKHDDSTTVTSMPYGVAADCEGPKSQTGVGKIDLRGTPFAVYQDEEFLIDGSDPIGEAVFSSNRQVVDLKGGGNCGWINPAPWMYNPFNQSGGPRLELEQIFLDRNISFRLKSGVAVYGGFAGTETALAQQEWKANPTILSGDIDDNDPTVDGVVADPAQISGENAYHVVVGSEVDETAVLDGFIVTAGKADGEESPDDYGGGMFSYCGSPTVRNVTVTGNWAIYGGGLGNLGTDSCDSRPTFDRLVISNNFADSSGGGMYDQFGQVTLTNVVFAGNTAESDAGGMYIEENDAELTNVTFSGNSAGNTAGGMRINSSNPTLMNVTFSGNAAGVAGGAIEMTRSTLTLTNAIVWGNTPALNQIDSDGDQSVLVRYSIIQGGENDILIVGEGFLSDDPHLGPLADNGGATLTHALDENSPAIDAGDPENCPMTDQRGVPRPIDGDGDEEARCDIGAYEYRPPFVLILMLVMK